MSKFLNFFYIKFPVFITSGSRLTSYLILDQDQINELTSQIGGVGGAGILYNIPQGCTALELQEGLSGLLLLFISAGSNTVIQL